MVVERRLEGRRADVPVEDTDVRMVEDRRLDSPVEQRLRAAHEVLVERVLARDEHRKAMSTASRASPLLAQARDGAGEADRDRAVEEADVDPELERVGRADAEELALDESALDVAPLRGGVPGPIGREPLGHVRGDAVDGEAVHELRRLAALREADRPQAAGDESGVEARCLAERARAEAQLRVDERRVPERDRPFRARRRVLVHHRRFDAEKGAGELARVRDRRRGEQELRVGAVHARDPAQPAEDVPDVRAEDAAVHVRLVDDDVAEVREHVAPAVVVREHAHVEHVRVGQDEVGPAADLPAPLGRRVAVVDRGAHPRHAERREAPSLVLRERLRGVEVEGARLRVAGERVEDRQVEGERLPARGAGGDDHVLPAGRGLPGHGLVDVERVEALRVEGGAHARVELDRDRGGAGRRGGYRLRVREPLPLKELVPEGDAQRRHRIAITCG